MQEAEGQTRGQYRNQSIYFCIIETKLIFFPFSLYTGSPLGTIIRGNYEAWYNTRGSVITNNP